MGKRKFTVLVIDDDENFIKVAKQLIGLIPDVKLVGSVTSSTKGVKFLLEKPVDMVLLDIDMPQMDGFKVMKQIQPLVRPIDPAVRPLFVIMCSGYDARPQECFENGVSYFLEKPLSYDGLVDAITTFKNKMGIVPTRDEIQGTRRLFLAKEAGSKKVSPTALDDITCIMVDGAISTLYRTDNRIEIYMKALNEFLDFLPGHTFVQISRSVIISLDHFLYREEEEVFVKNVSKGIKLGSRESYPAFYQWYDDNYEGTRLAE